MDLDAPNSQANTSQGPTRLQENNSDKDKDYKSVEAKKERQRRRYLRRRLRKEETAPGVDGNFNRPVYNDKM